MREAGLTAGGFYAHFNSKEALMAEALAHVGSELEGELEGRLEGLSGREWLVAFIDRYLSTSHRGNLEAGCPIAALLTDVARSGEPIRGRFEAIFRALSALVASHAKGGFKDDREFAILALCVGGLGLSRSVPDVDLGDRILVACAKLAKDSCPAS